MSETAPVRDQAVERQLAGVIEKIPGVNWPIIVVGVPELGHDHESVYFNHDEIIDTVIRDQFHINVNLMTSPRSMSTDRHPARIGGSTISRHSPQDRNSLQDVYRCRMR